MRVLHLINLIWNEGNTDYTPQARGARKPAAEKASSAVAHSVERLLDTVITSTDDSKAKQPVTIDIKGKSPIADYMVVVSGRSHRHVGAIADHLLPGVEGQGYGTARVDGLPACDWVLIDASDGHRPHFPPGSARIYNIENVAGAGNNTCASWPELNRA
ncbi:MAG: ribosome silencing factor [Nitratireductor sp.]